MQLLRHDTWSFLFFHAIEAPAVNHPDTFFAFSVRVRRRTTGLGVEFRETTIQPRKIVSGADPKNAGKDMGPTEKEMDEFLKIAQEDMNMNPAKQGIERHARKI